MLGPLSWVLVYTADIPKMRAYYETVLGLPVKRGSEKIVAFSTGACTLELMGRMDNGPNVMDDSRGWKRNKVLISFHVADIKAEVAALEGARRKMPERHPRHRLARRPAAQRLDRPVRGPRRQYHRALRGAAGLDPRAGHRRPARSPARQASSTLGETIRAIVSHAGSAWPSRRSTRP
ncbi:MAG: VOC family protein [Pseudomonadota bacterium]